RHHLLVVLHWLLPRADAASLLAATKDGWLPLHTACRCGAVEEAVAYLRAAERLGLLREEGSREAILSDPTPFNRYYRDHGGVQVLQRALEQVWPDPALRPAPCSKWKKAVDLKNHAE
ncbi:hypothetical protein Agub_g2700, partial [Astrephomene gubernaculifera]